MEQRLNSDFIEKIIVKGMLSDKDFLILISSVFEPEYFDDPSTSHIFKYCREYSDEYNRIPSSDIIINSSDSPDEIRQRIEESQSLDFDVSGSYQLLLDQSNDYLKEKAIKRAIVDSIDDVEIPERRAIIQKRIEEAIIKDLKIDLGLRYFEDIGTRLRRIFEASENRIPTYFPVFDEIINGGFPPFTFNTITAKIHGGKSNFMANLSARQVLNGHNVCLLTLEMSQDAFAQRFDGIYSLLDINRMYMGEEYKRRLVRRLREVKNTENRGELFIKQYPTGTASVLNFRIYLRELMLRDIPIDIIYVDYINLMKSAYNKDNSLYGSVKAISEELRALSFEFKCPVVSVSQLNREGFYTSFDEVNFNHMAESMGIAATSDFVAILGTDEEKMIYESEVLYKIIKSRIGGRVGVDDKFYLDKKSLKMYDSSELQMWEDDATISGDDRDTIDHEENQREERRNTRGNNNRGRN